MSLFHEATKGWAEEKVWFWTKLHLFSSLECSHERLVNEIFNQVLSTTIDPLAIEAWKEDGPIEFSQIYESSDLSWEVIGQKGLGRYCFWVRKAIAALLGYTSLSALGWTALEPCCSLFSGWSQRLKARLRFYHLTSCKNMSKMMVSIKCCLERKFAKIICPEQHFAKLIRINLENL